MSETTQNQLASVAARVAEAVKRAIANLRDGPWLKAGVFLIACVAGWMLAWFVHRSANQMTIVPDVSLGRLGDILQRIVDFGGALFR